MISAVLLRGIALPTLLALSLRLWAWPLQALLRSGALRSLHNLLRSGTLRSLHHLLQVRALRLLSLRLMPLGLPPLQRLQWVLALRLSALAMPAIGLLTQALRLSALALPTLRLRSLALSLMSLAMLALRLLALAVRDLRLLALALRLTALAVGRRTLTLQDVSARLGQGVSSLEGLLGSRSRALCRQAVTLRR